MTPAEVAQELHVSPTTIYRAVDDGRLTAHRLGRHRQGETDRRGLSISRAALNVFLEKSRVRPRIRGTRTESAFSGADLMETARRMAIRGGR